MYSVTAHDRQQFKCHYFMRLLVDPAKNPGGGQTGGSYPEPPSGLHRRIRQVVKTKPLKNVKFECQ